MNTHQGNSNKFVAISGYVRINDTDKGGHVIQTVLETDGMEKYVIDNSQAGIELVNYIGKRVVVIGTILHQDYMDYELIIVNKFNVTEN